MAAQTGASSASASARIKPEPEATADSADIRMADLPAAGDAKTTSEPAEPADIVMEGTDESESALSRGASAAAVEDANSTASASAAPATRLRKSHLLKRLWEQRQEQEAKQDVPQRVPSMDEQVRESLRRSICLVLEHVGFDAASDEALESFLLMTETYLLSLAQDVVRVAHTARRNHPIPTDYDLSLARFNLSTSSLRPHLRNPVSKSKLAPTYKDPLSSAARQQLSQHRDLPLLSDDLSGRAEKEAKPYIPAGFPDFPSIHTYRHTPIDVASVTVHGSGLRYDDGDPVLFDDGTSSSGIEASDQQQQQQIQIQIQRQWADGAGALRRDPKRIREMAAVEAKQAEEALRSLMRASKINKLKEVRAAAARNSLNKQRFTLWEAAMRELIEEKESATEGTGAVAQPKGQHPLSRAAVRKGSGSAGAAPMPAVATLREEIADQSMMVNADKVFHRKEIPRKPVKRPGQKT